MEGQKEDELMGLLSEAQVCFLRCDYEGENLEWTIVGEDNKPIDVLGPIGRLVYILDKHGCLEDVESQNLESGNYRCFKVTPKIMGAKERRKLRGARIRSILDQVNQITGRDYEVIRNHDNGYYVYTKGDSWAKDIPSLEALNDWLTQEYGHPDHPIWIDYEGAPPRVVG